MTRRPSIVEPALTRRRFVRGVAAGGALAAARPVRGAFAAPHAPVLSGNDFQLETGPLPVNWRSTMSSRLQSREITLHLTGNMDRFNWSFDGKKYSEAEPIVLQRGERVRFTLTTTR
jgi:hypothetical protein